MHKILGVLVTLFTMVAVPLWPGVVQADIMSNEQQVVIHAEIAANRIIIVNDKGQMTTIFSNTSQNVTPEVRLKQPAGAVQMLTPALLAQYEQVIKSHSNMTGVSIAVPEQLAPKAALQQLEPPSRLVAAANSMQTSTVTKFMARLSPPFFIKS